MDPWPRSIRAITLFVEDLEAAKQFYQAAFGLPVFFETEDSAGSVKASGTCVAQAAARRKRGRALASCGNRAFMEDSNGREGIRAWRERRYRRRRLRKVRQELPPRGGEPWVV